MSDIAIYLKTVQIGPNSVDQAKKDIDGLEDGDYEYIYIQNTHASNTLYVSMDGGQHWTTLTPTKYYLILESPWEHPIRIKKEDWKVNSSGTATTYEVVLLRAMPVEG
jgi:hypothetical protein